MPSKPSSHFDVIAIGESLRDVFYMMHDKNVDMQLDTERNFLCFEYAEKIPVKYVVKVPAAGNSSNAAVGVSRLGLKSALVSWIGKDDAGLLAQGALEQDAVDIRFLTVDPKYPTSEATIINFLNERTQLVYFQPREYKLPTLPSARCIYYSAMGERHASFDTDLNRYLTDHMHLFFVFQPGTTHVLAGLKKMKPLIARSNLFILNLDEAHHLLPDGERTMLNLLESFHRLGANTVIITDGNNGAHGYDGKEHWFMPIIPAKIVEKTGAGDSFATAVTVAHLKGKPLSEALRWGAINSASVIGAIGPQAGLLSAKKMNENLKKHTKYKALRIHP
ncbi:MAG: carbohydrate kinase family protein [Patescibacteria group bacterium]